jgi:hypothetical protein
LQVPEKQLDENKVKQVSSCGHVIMLLPHPCELLLLCQCVVGPHVCVLLVQAMADLIAAQKADKEAQRKRCAQSYNRESVDRIAQGASGQAQPPPTELQAPAVQRA